MLESTIWAMNEEQVRMLAHELQDKPSLAGFGDDDEIETDSVLLAVRNRGVAEIPVQGSIVRKKSFRTIFGNATSGGQIIEALNEAEENDSIEKVVLNIDSPGGKAAGTASVAQKVKSMETETIAFGSGQMLSAAYWIGSAADKVYAAPNSMVGSIGVYSLLVSMKGMEEEKGIDTKIVRSTEKKGLEHPSEPINEKAVKKQQRMVDKMHENFVRAVATNRNLSTEYVNDTMADGDVRVGDEAEDESFTDDTMTLDELFQSFEYDEDSDLSRTEQENNFLRSKTSDLLEQVSELNDTVQVLSSKVEDIQEEKKSSEIDRIVAKAIDEDNKFPPARRDDLKAQLAEDFESAKQMIEMTPEGAAAPSEPIEESDEENEDIDRKKEKLTSRGVIPAHTEEEAEVLSQIGEEYSDGSGDWFKVYEIDKYDVET